MKSSTSTLLLYCLLAAVSSLLADDHADTKTVAAPEAIHSSKETRMLYRLLQMEDHELTKLRQTIERIEKMPPEERAELRERIGTIHRMPPEHVDAMRKRFKAIPREQREAMHTRWMEMSMEERAELRSELREMPPEERRDFLEKKGLLPPLPHPRKAPPPENEKTVRHDHYSPEPTSKED